MGSKAKFAGAGMGAIAIILVLLFTNVYDLAKPSVDQGVNSAKDAISKVDGEDVVSTAETVSSKIKNETSKIEIRDPFD